MVVSSSLTIPITLKKGGDILVNTVEPIRDFNIIQDIADVLREQRERDYVLFMSGLYLGRRISDILPLRVRDVRDKKQIYFREKKKNKEITLDINDDLRKIFKDYCKGKRDYEYLFRRSKGKNEPITRQQYWYILNQAAKKIGYEEKIGCHSMRKSLGRWLYDNGVDVYKIMLILNHESIDYTKRYIGVTRDEINDVLSMVSFIKK